MDLPLIMCARGIVKYRVLESADFTGSKLYRIGWTRQPLCAAPRILVQSVMSTLRMRQLRDERPGSLFHARSFFIRR